MVLPPIYKIHPAIGIARLGDVSKFFIGPETPGMRPAGDPPGTKVPPYKHGGKIKPQAARFRIFEYIDRGGDYAAKREVSLAEKDVTKLRWTVHLANRKASFFKFEGLEGEERRPTKGRRNAAIADRRKLEIDPKPRSISGKNARAVEFSQGTSPNPSSELWPDPKPSPEITTLGRLMTDGEGRLLVIGGSGKSVSIPGAPAISDYANNDGWFDDVSDGPVSAWLELKGRMVTVQPAWVICGPPDFAPHLPNTVTLYDLLFDLAARETAIPIPANEAAYKTGPLKGLAAIRREFAAAGKPELSSYQPDFTTEVYPILFCAFSSMFTFEPAAGVHRTFVISRDLSSKAAADKPARKYVFDFLRPPDSAPFTKYPQMPKLLGDEPYPLDPSGVIHQRVRLTVTPTQYAIMKQWAEGKFIEPATFPPPSPSRHTFTPEGLDKAALENCVGGALFPGIEVGWQIRFKSIFAEPFRIKPYVASQYLGDSYGIVEAGYFTRQMALPWQADFLQCKSEPDDTGIFGGIWGWWPGQRPDSVFASEADFRASPPKRSLWHRATARGVKIPWPAGGGDGPTNEEMLANWTKFGFILEKRKNLFIESEREADIP
jgi:hypothetical protein